jgi:hypothetical protein
MVEVDPAWWFRQKVLAWILLVVMAPFFFLGWTAGYLLIKRNHWWGRELAWLITFTQGILLPFILVNWLGLRSSNILVTIFVISVICSIALTVSLLNTGYRSLCKWFQNKPKPKPVTFID